MCAQSLSCVRLFATAWTVACQAPLSIAFSKQEYWSGSHWSDFLQGIFLTQRSNPGLLHCRQIPYCLSQQGRPLQQALAIQSMKKLGTEEQMAKNGLRYKHILQKLTQIHQVSQSISQGENYIWPSPRHQYSTLQYSLPH